MYQAFPISLPSPSRPEWYFYAGLLAVAWGAVSMYVLRKRASSLRRSLRVAIFLNPCASCSLSGIALVLWTPDHLSVLALIAFAGAGLCFLLGVGAIAVYLMRSADHYVP